MEDVKIKSNPYDAIAFVSTSWPGLTKREYFAALALNGLIANSNNEKFRADTLAETACAIADHLINALNSSIKK